MPLIDLDVPASKNFTKEWTPTAHEFEARFLRQKHIS